VEKQSKIEKVCQNVKEMALYLGASSVGIVTRENLEGGPPSTDLSYVLPEAKSAICFALSLDQNAIEPYLSKKDHQSHNLDNTQKSLLASGIALEIANYLKQNGYPAVAQSANIEYRSDTKNGPFDELPPISHRYLAVRSGIGHFGLSGNVITIKDGAAIALSSVVTQAELNPTDPLPKDDNYCDDCRLCIASCAAGFMDPKDKITISMGGIEFSYSKRRHHVRCDYVCGGFAGLHKTGKWSTWSPSRFPIPETDDGFMKMLPEAAKAFMKRPSPKEGPYHFLVPGHKLELTCCHCMLVCHPDKDVRNKRHKILIESGVIVQDADGARKAVTAEEAIKHIDSMKPERKALYEYPE
jgi:epoxyqueuosine reductase